MINYLRHTEVDKRRWDQCIAKSANRRVYAFSWYLDIVCPGWDALVEDEYAAVFPLTQRRKGMVSYLFQPYFTQQLGLFSPERLTAEKLREFISAIPPRFRFAEIHLNSGNDFPGDPGSVKRRVNYELNLEAGYAVLAGNFSQNTRRNLKKAGENGITVSRATGIDDLIALFRENYGKREGKLKDKDYRVLRQLMVECAESGSGYALSAETAEGMSAGAFFLFDQFRVYFLFAASAPSARTNGAMFFLIDRFIQGHAGKPLVLDFEGGNDPDLGRFYKSFGAAEVHYPALQIDRLSKVARSGLFFLHRLRK